MIWRISDSAELGGDVRRSSHPRQVVVVYNPAANDPYVACVNAYAVAKLVGAFLQRLIFSFKQRLDDILKRAVDFQPGSDCSGFHVIAQKDAHNTVTVIAPYLPTFPLYDHRRAPQKALEHFCGNAEVVVRG